MPSRIDQLAFILVIFLAFSGTYVLARPSPNGGRRVTFASGTKPAPSSPQGQGVSATDPSSPLRADPKEATTKRPDIRDPEPNIPGFTQGLFNSAKDCFASKGDTWVVQMETHEDNADAHNPVRWKWVSPRTITTWNLKARKYMNKEGWCYRRGEDRTPIFRNGQEMGAAECSSVGGNMWYDPCLPDFRGPKEVVIFETALKSINYRNRLGKCYYFDAKELEAKKKSWDSEKKRAKAKKDLGCWSWVKAKGKEPAKRPNDFSRVLGT